MDSSVSYSVLSDILINQSKEAFFTFMKSKFALNDVSFELYRRQINQFVINHDHRWKKKSKFRKNHFDEQYADWLQQKFSLKSPQDKKELKPFDQCSERTKKRRLAAMTKPDEPGPSSSSSVTKRQKNKDSTRTSTA